MQESIRKRLSFTLIELLITLSIFSIVILSIYSAFHTGVFGYRDIEKNLMLTQSAQRILNRIDIDLRNAFVYSSDALKGDSRFQGEPTSVSFFTLVDVYRGNEITQEYARVSYISQQRECRRNAESLKEPSGTQAIISDKEELAPDVDITLVFRYKDVEAGINPDDVDYQDKWPWPQGDPDPSKNEAAKKKLPKFVEIKLTVKEKNEAVDENRKISKEFIRHVFIPTS